MLSTGMQFFCKSWRHCHSLGLFQLNAWCLKKIENKKPSGIFLEKLGHFVLWPLCESRSTCRTASVLKSLSSAHLLKTPVFFYTPSKRTSTFKKTPKQPNKTTLLPSPKQLEPKPKPPTNQEKPLPGERRISSPM